jgi:hypothetical protein
MTPPILGIFASAVTGGVSTTSFESIATVTVGSGGASNVEFTSIPATYTHLQVRGIVQSANDTYVGITFNGVTGTSYAAHNLSGDGSNAGAQAYTSRANVFISNPPTGSSQFEPFVIDILDYANTNKYKTIRALNGADANGSGSINLTSGLFMDTTAISSIKFTMNTGNLNQYSSFALYGIKSA